MNISLFLATYWQRDWLMDNLIIRTNKGIWNQQKGDAHSSS